MNEQPGNLTVAGPSGKSTAGRSARAGCVAFVNDPQSRAAIQAVCQPRQEKFTLHEGGSRDAAEYVARNTLPRILIIDISDSDQPMDALLPVLAAAGDSTRVIAIGTTNDIGLYRELIEAGVTDYLAKPLSDRAVLSAIHRAEGQDTAAKTPGMGASSRIVVVMGTRGGVGASTVAANIAWLLAEERKKRTALLDLDLQFGTVSLTFDIEPSRGLREALQQPNRIDSLLVNSAAVRLTERLAVLAAEEGHEEELRYEPAAITLLLDELAQQNEFIVVDLPLHPATYRGKVLPMARDIILLTDLSLAGLRDSIRICTQVQKTASTARLLVVGCRPSSHDSGVTRAEFEKSLGRKLAMILPDDHKAAAMAAARGKPLAVAARGSKLTGALRQLTAQLSDAKGRTGSGWRPFAWFSKG
jgi:pilus assembly protein CpaE